MSEGILIQIKEPRKIYEALSFSREHYEPESREHALSAAKLTAPFDEVKTTLTSNGSNYSLLTRVGLENHNLAVPFPKESEEEVACIMSRDVHQAIYVLGPLREFTLSLERGMSIAYGPKAISHQADFCSMLGWYSALVAAALNGAYAKLCKRAPSKIIEWNVDSKFYAKAPRKADLPGESKIDPSEYSIAAVIRRAKKNRTFNPKFAKRKN
jgi:hypothetical protein